MKNQLPNALRGLILLLLGGGILAGLTPTTAFSQQTAATLATSPAWLGDGNFENPNAGTNPGYIYRPAGTAWSYFGGSGVSANNTAFTRNNPNAPQGSQVAFLQGGGYIRQDLSLSAGHYQFQFEAAQRGISQLSYQVLDLRIDGTSIGTFQPAGTNYQLMASATVYLSSGSHSIELRGLNPNGGDNTAFVDDFRWERKATADLPGGGAESPVLSASPGYEYRPTGGPWTFVRGAGISRNSTAFTQGNPNAPEGNQVIFLQRTGKATLPFTVSDAGPYRIVFDAALRGNNLPEAQTVHVRINNSKLGTFDLESFNYETFTSQSLYLSPGSHSLSIEGLNPQGDDNTAFVDHVRLQRINDWQDAAAWTNGGVPNANTDVMIPAGAAVGFRGTMNASGTMVHGEFLASQNLSFHFSTKYIMAMGQGAEVVVGRAQTPYEMSGRITLTGSATDPSIHSMGTKLIGAMNGGALYLHGRQRLPWTHLEGTAQVGDNQIRLAEPVYWGIGDSLVIASTDYDPHQAEVRAITGLSGDRKTVTLNAPLNFMHYGQVDSYHNGAHQLDMRAEVGLLSRNLRIEGDAASEADGFGGHIMVMVNSEAYVSDVELFRMGQKSILGRYPFHWHRAASVAGQYIKNASIHRTYNRAVTVHASDDALVEGNVGFDHIGHGFFLEGGNEMGNVFRNNLGILTRKPKPGEEVEPHDIETLGIYTLLPATFWITNPANDFVGNVAAGSEGSGFWQVSLSQPLEGSTPQAPKYLPMGLFDDNVAHSNSFANYAIDGGVDKNTHEFVGGHYSPRTSPGNPVVPVVNRFTGYKVQGRNLWIRANTMDFNEVALSDAQVLILFAYNQRMTNSLLVGRSNNLGTPSTNHEINAGRTLALSTASLTSGYNRVVGYKVYDGPSEFTNVHFAGYGMDNTWCFQPNGAAQKSTVHQVQGLSFAPDVRHEDKVDFAFMSQYDHMYSTGVIDNDGSLTGVAGTRITPRIIPPAGAPVYRVYSEDFNHEPGAALDSDWDAFLCTQEHYGLLRMDNKWPSGTGTPAYGVRSDGPATYVSSPGNDRFQNPVMVNGSYQYRFMYHRLAHQIESSLRFVNNGDELVSVLENVPSSTRITQGNGSALLQASNLNDLVNSSTQKYLLRDNRLYLKHVATNGGSNAQFGNDFSAMGQTIRICQNNNCADASGRTEFMTLADFEQGADSRLFTNASVGVSITPVQFDAGADPFDATDNKVSWTITTNGDGVDGHAQLGMNFDPQVWTEFKTMRLKFSGAPLQVFVRDADQGYINLGTFQPGDDVYVPLTAGQDPSTYTQFDKVNRILLRTKEGHIGGVHSVQSATVELYAVELYDEVVTAKAGPESPLADAVPLGLQGFQLQPNPSEGQLGILGTFRQAGSATLEVFGLQGQLVYREDLGRVEAGSFSYHKDLSGLGLSAGVYQVRLRHTTEGTQTMRLLVRP